jgi:hypothetical protein
MEVGSATSGVLLPASFARPFSIFGVCEGSIPNPLTAGTLFTLHRLNYQVEYV